MTSDREILAAIAAITTLLVIGAVYGRVHRGGNGKVSAIGDRVMAGLLALPLIALLVRLAFPEESLAWAFLAPVPLAWYVVMLAGTDLDWKWCQDSSFTKWLLIGIGMMYVIAVTALFLTAV
jgi:ABC-type dipeptide/oligopeptide/nickel transport system permease subunit